ncbi:hypothetical protein EPD60_15130 [Flaviaesturariibacter flavus]|uniref:DUF4402 domain-containing protein n=1 Tax=Flaviaesturariibacter flavus TaxID=2502780 RepID=A0A4R1B8T2_9BACT|nr:hypothetical protein [Flaviaesturariibacter flavus]TCJ12599.1 hypothetical protein EPD60_15130 [Flaviaesturariibacter flavus]
MKKIALVLFAVCGFAAANAQTNATASTSGQTVTLVLNNALTINYTPNTTHTMTFTTVADYTSGIELQSAGTVTVSSNKSYHLTAKAATANFADGGVTTTTMPASVLQVQVNGGTVPYQGLSTTDQNIGNFSRGSGNVHNIDYKAVPGLNYDADTYTINVVFTATQY